MQVVYKLWESSFDEDAVVRDAAGATYVDPSKVHPIDHTGEYFTVPGVHLCEPSPQRTPVLFQAGLLVERNGLRRQARRGRLHPGDLRRGGQAQRGQDPAGRWQRRARSPRHPGRRPDHRRRRRHRRGGAGEVRQDLQNATLEGCLARFSGWTGIDMSDYDLDTPLRTVATKGSAVDRRHVLQGRPGPRLDAARRSPNSSAIGGTGSTIVGSPETVAAELRRWRDEADVDGINLSYTTKPGSWADFIELALPELRAQGLVSPQRPADQKPVTMREKLFPGHKRTLDSHPASAFRAQRLAATTS